MTARPPSQLDHGPDAQTPSVAGDGSAGHSPTADSSADRIDVFYQREAFREVEHVEFDGDLTLAQLKNQLAEKHGLHADVCLFLEDEDELPDEHDRTKGHAKSEHVKVHLHRCRHVTASVTFNSRTVEHRFGPGATVQRVKLWATKQFGLSHADASEHVLQLAGTHDRPPPGMHLGTLATCPQCVVSFDLLPDQRING